MSGLVGHWPLHEWAGDAQDLSGNGNTGTVNGATQGVWGKGGLTAYSFDSSDDRVDTTLDMDSGSDFTCCLWLKIDALEGHDVVADVSDSNNNGFILFVNNGPYEVRFGGYNSSGSFIRTDGGVELSTGTWYHVAAVHKSGTEIRTYVDGEENNSLSDSVRDSNKNFTIADRPSTNNPFGGGMFDVRVYNRALSPQEIQTLYQWGSGDYTKQSLHDGTDSGAVSRYEFTSGSVTADSWGSNTLTDNTSAGTTTDAIRGDAKSFDGTDDYISSSYQADFGTNPFTVSCWMKPNDAGYTVNNYDGSSGWILQYYITSNSFRWANGSENISSDVDLSGSWSHVCGIMTGSELRLYVNGTLVNTGNQTASVNSNATLEIGRESGTDNKYYGGEVDDVRIYDRALSSWEVAQLYRWGTRGRDMRAQMVRK